MSKKKKLELVRQRAWLDQCFLPVQKACQGKAAVLLAEEIQEKMGASLAEQGWTVSVRKNLHVCAECVQEGEQIGKFLRLLATAEFRSGLIQGTRAIDARVRLEGDWVRTLESRGADASEVDPADSGVRHPGAGGRGAVVDGLPPVEGGYRQENETDRHYLENLSRRPEQALAPPDFEPQMRDCVRDLTAFAAGVRTADAALFRQTLETVQAAKELTLAARRSVTAADRRALSEARRLERELEKRRKTAEDTARDAARIRAEAEQERRNKERLLQKLQSEAKRAEESAGLIRKLGKELTFSVHPGVVQKGTSSNQRAEFPGGTRAVQTSWEIGELLETDLYQLNAGQKQRVLTYIRTNARIFRQSQRRKVAAPRHRSVDKRHRAGGAADRRRTGADPLQGT